MHNHSQSGSDLVVSFDAFKITRHGPSPEHGTATRWELHALASAPFAAAMMRDPRAFGIAQRRGAVVLKGMDGGSLPPTQFQYGLGFERRQNALAFLRDLEAALR